MDCDQAKGLSHESEMGFDYSGRSQRIVDNKTAAAFLYYRSQTDSLTVSYGVRGRAGRGFMPDALRGEGCLPASLPLALLGHYW
jgi:hypothetical protein